jgi:hypothetical protein
MLFTQLHKNQSIYAYNIKSMSEFEIGDRHMQLANRVPKELES